MKSYSKRSLYRKQDMQMDAYSTSILEQLLENNQQWRNSDQIIKLTFRAITDIIQVHGQSIKDIKHVLTTRASKNQLTTGLSLKANISDISNTIDQISMQIQQRPSYDVLNKILKQYTPRQQITQTLSNKYHQTRFKQQVQTKDQSNANLSTTNLQLQIIQTRMDQFQKHIAKQISNYVSLNQFQEALNIIDNKVNTNQLNQLLDNLVNKQFLTTCLQKKLNKNDIQSYLQSKADVNDLEYIVSSLQSKVNLSTLQKLTQVIQNKADKSDIMMLINQKNSLSRSNQRNNIQSSMLNIKDQKMQQLRVQLSNQIIELKHRIDQVIRNKYQSAQQSLQQSKKLSLLRNQLHESMHLLKLQYSKQISQFKIQQNQNISILKNQYKILTEQINYKKNNQTIIRQLNNQINLRKRCQQKIYQEIDQLRKKYQQNNNKIIQIHQNVKINQLNQNIMHKLKIDIQNSLLKKIDHQSLMKTLASLQKNIYSKFDKDNQTNTLLLQKLQKTYSQAISTNTTDIIKLTKNLSKKQDKYQYTIVEQNIKKSRKQIQQCRNTVDKIYQQLQSKLSIIEYENDLLQIKKRFDKLFQQTQTKANIKDVCILADSKPNIDDVNNALKELNQLLNQKISQNQLQNILKDQSAINQTLCSQNIIGRWMWQSGDLKAGGLVPWEIQSANTVPEHFFWQKDKTSILILAPGIYQIKSCVFNKNSIITLIINGQTINDNNKNDQNSNNMNRNKSISKKKHKNNTINGNSIEQFVLLPARSRVSLCCLGEIGEGFINIKRM